MIQHIFQKPGGQKDANNPSDSQRKQIGQMQGGDRVHGVLIHAQHHYRAVVRPDGTTMVALRPETIVLGTHGADTVSTEHLCIGEACDDIVDTLLVEDTCAQKVAYVAGE